MPDYKRDMLSSVVIAALQDAVPDVGRVPPKVRAPLCERDAEVRRFLEAGEAGEAGQGGNNE